MNSKKAQGISLQTVITAAIVLIVLLVLWAIFTGRLQIFSQEIVSSTQSTCTAENIAGVEGSWESSCTDTQYKESFSIYSDKEADKVCCYKKHNIGAQCAKDYQCGGGTCKENKCINAVTGITTQPSAGEERRSNRQPPIEEAKPGSS